MPTIPKTQKLNATSIQILNAIRNENSQSYRDRVPIATQENIRDVGKAINHYKATQNEFLNTLVNRIGRVMITSKMYENPLREFKRGMLEYGETIEEIFVNIAKAHEFNPELAEKTVYKREIPDVLTVFHKINYRNFYKTTISTEQLRTAFLSMDGVTDLISKIVDSLYTGAEYDEFLIMKQLIAEAVKDGRMYPVKIPDVNSDNAKEIVSIIKGISNSLEFMSNTYNSMGVLTHTKKTEQVLLIDAKFDAVIDVEVLASAFNMDKAEFMGRRVLVDNFGDITGVVAALVDRDWFMVFDQLISFTENYNGEGLYWNYFYHVWKLFSSSPFSNAIIFTTDDVGVTSVTVTPNTATAHKGDTIQFTAGVITSGYAPKGVEWTVNTTNSMISPDGVLYVGDEAGASITVTAVSKYDNTISGTATVTVE